MKRITVTIIALSAALLSTPALARTWTFHGTACQPVFPAGIVPVPDLGYSQFGVHNNSTNPATIECPLGTYSPLSGRTLLHAQMSVYDRSTTADVACELRNVNSAGGIVRSFSAISQGGGPGTISQILDFEVEPGTPFLGFWVLHCTLPGSEGGALSHVTTTVLVTD